MPPLFIWYVNIITIARFQIIFFLRTYQKLLPLFRRFFFFSNLRFVFLLRTFICILGSRIQLIVKKLLAFSSIFNLLWIFLVLENLLIVYLFFFIYMFLILWVCKTFKSLKNKELISDIFLIRITENQKIMIILRILSLAGIPPFLIFNGKILIIMYRVMLCNIKFFWVLFLLISAIPMIYFYLRLVFFLSTRKKIIFSNRIIVRTNDFKYFFLNKIFGIFYFLI